MQSHVKVIFNLCVNIKITCKLGGNIINNKINQEPPSKKIQESITKENDIKRSTRILLSKFIDIRNKGYIKSIRKGSTGVGATFEYCIGKKEDSLEEPDFYGVEIKVRRAYSKSKISLFNYAPLGNGTYESKRLLEKYGYPKKNDKHLKRLYAEAICGDMTKVGLWYYFELIINENKLILNVYNHRKELIDNTTYWSIETLKEKISKKLTYLVLIKAWRKYNEEIEYFKYFSFDFYKLKGCDKFIELIKNGIIKVIFKIDTDSNKEKYGEVLSHGVSFEIEEEKLSNLYNLYDIKKDEFIE